MEENKERKYPKRLLIEIDEELHQDLKFLAIKKNISLKLLVTRVLTELIIKESKYE